MEKIVLNDEDKENRRPGKIACREENRQQVIATEHHPSGVLPASAPGVVPASFVPSFAARLPKIKDYVEVTLKNGSQSIQLFVQNDSKAGATGHE